MPDNQTVDATGGGPLTTQDRRRLLTRLYDLHIQRLVAAHERGETSAALTMATQKVLDAQGIDLNSLQRDADGPLPDALMTDLPDFSDDPAD